MKTAFFVHVGYGEDFSTTKYYGPFFTKDEVDLFIGLSAGEVLGIQVQFLPQASQYDPDTNMLVHLN